MDIIIQNKTLIVPVLVIVAIMLSGTVAFLSIRSTKTPEAF